MKDLHNFSFTTTLLSEEMVELVTNFMYELDQFAGHFDIGRTGPGLLDSLLQRLLDGEADGDLMLDVLHSYLDRTQAKDYSMTREDGFKLMMTIIRAALDFAVHALQAQSDTEACRCLLKAQHLRGFADGVIFQGNDALVRADLARVAVKARHTETNEMKKRIWTWYAEHHRQFKSVDAAAREATNREPIVFTTAQRWIVAYRKLNNVR
jgi:hypothetical protein